MKKIRASHWCWILAVANAAFVALNVWLYSTGGHHALNAISIVVNSGAAIWCAYCAIDIARLDRQHDAFIARIAAANQRYGK